MTNDRDRRYDDDLPPQRPSRPRDDAPRSGPPSRPRDADYGGRSSTPSRSRSGDTPSRGRADDGYGARSGPPSRPRSADAPSSQGRGYGDSPPRSRGYDDRATPSRSRSYDDRETPSRSRSYDDRNTPSRSRSYDDGRGRGYDDRATPSRSSGRSGYDDYGAGAPRRRGDEEGYARDSRSARGGGYDDEAPPRRRSADGTGQGGAREMMRRVRDGFTDTFASLRAGGRGSDDRYRSRSRTRDDGYGRSAEWEDAPADAPRRSSSARANSALPASLTDRDAASRSLARRLIARRRRVREGGMAPGKRAVISAALAVVAVLVIVGGGFGTGYAYADTLKYDKEIGALGLSQDATSSRIYDRHGTLLYQTLGQNSDHRFPINYCQIPDVMKWATIDTEDHNFWTESTGIDPIGLLRAATVNARSSDTQGGSTITQQLVKLKVLGNSSQNLGRKIDEAILAVDVSQRFTRQDVLTMYLNVVPYGFNNDGIEAAARAYFHLQPISITLNSDNSVSLVFTNTTTPNQTLKPTDAGYQKYKGYYDHYTQCAKDQGITLDGTNTIIMSSAWQLEPWQATLLAGVPNNPNSYNPYLHPQASTERQRDGVLIQMEKYGHGNYLTTPDGKGNETPSDKEGVYEYTLSQIKVVNINNLDFGRHIFSNQYEGTGGVAELAPYFVEYVITQLSQYFSNGREGFDTAGWNVYTTLDYGTATVSDSLLDTLYIANDGTLQAKGYDPKKDHWLDDVGIQQYADYLTRRDITRDFPDYWYCGSSYAHPDPNRSPVSGSQNPFSHNEWCWETPLDNSYTHLNDGALTAIDPRTGDIVAMVGGVDYSSTGNTTLDGGQYNVTTAPRSMGSSFKPLVYATAFQMGWTPGIIAPDQPTCFPAASSTENGTADSFLCPNYYVGHNYSGSEWAGRQPITYLLGNSLNTPAELALAYVGLSASTTDPSPLFTMAQRLGITTLIPGKNGPATAIGTQNVKLLEFTGAYATFANNGYHLPPRAILQVTYADGSPIPDGKGGTLFAYVAQPKGYQAISPQAAYMLTSVLTNNTARGSDFGIENPLYFPGREVAAKTGTSDSKKDIVTMGYTPWLALGVWAGNADDSSAGNEVIGIAGAGYIFHDVMAFAINRMNMPGTLPSRFAPQKPGGYFNVPPNMHQAILNCQTGLAPWKGENVTDPKSFCDPTKDAVPAAISTEFSFCQAPNGKVPPPNPNEKLNCFGDQGKDKYFDTWTCHGWGCTDPNQFKEDGQDIAWVPNGQDPTAP